MIMVLGNALKFAKLLTDRINKSLNWVL